MNKELVVVGIHSRSLLEEMVKGRAPVGYAPRRYTGDTKHYVHDLVGTDGNVRPKYVTQNNRNKLDKELVVMEKGKYIAVVEYINPSYNGTVKQYDFFCGIVLEHGDTVVVESVNGLGLAEVVGVKKSSSKANKWVVDKVDLTAHNERREKERKLQELERQMEERSKKMSKLDRYRELAKHDPEMKKMLEEYQSTMGLNLIEGAGENE